GFRGRVSARGSGAGLAGALGPDRHGVRGPPQPFPALGGYLAPRARVHALRTPDHLRSAMNILISNDDGILARGLAVLGEVCASLGQVTVVAPDREQSGTSHSLTLHRPLHATRRPDATFQVDGTPTDCVLLAIGMLMPEKPDFVISGINHGQNMGEDVFYSGTVAAAMEGLVAGIPSIAVSYAGSDLDRRRRLRLPGDERRLHLGDPVAHGHDELRPARGRAAMVPRRLTSEAAGDTYGGYRVRLVETLRLKGIRDLAVLKAFAETPRHLFVPEAVRHRAYEDVALPIGNGQTISQPFTQARYLAALRLTGKEKVLEIGTGSGYQTALLGALAATVFSVER